MRITTGLRLTERFLLAAGGGSNNLRDFQSRCLRISNHAAGESITNIHLRDNFAYILDGTGGITLTLPTDITVQDAARIIVFNPSKVLVTIQGTRKASVRYVEVGTTDAPYFEVIADKFDEESMFSNFNIIHSE